MGLFTDAERCLFARGIFSAAVGRKVHHCDMPWIPLTPESASEMAGCIEYLLVEASGYLGRHAEHFPVLTSAEAETCLSRQSCRRTKEDGLVLYLHGLRFPDEWPVAVRVVMQTIYVIWVVGEGETGRLLVG